jgi:hypothetical protein
MHKGFKCLDLSSGCIYISRDVIFDEQVFPFTSLHSTAGPRYQESGNNTFTNTTNPPTVSVMPLVSPRLQLQLLRISTRHDIHCTSKFIHVGLYCTCTGRN